MHCGITDTDRQLIPVNFFLHNTIVSGVNYVTADELVRHAINNPHSRRFDQLALFSLHSGRMGRRAGVAGDPRGAAFVNDFVRNRLWDNGGWQTDRLNEAELDSAFGATISAQSDDTVHKCVTNYLYMMEITGLKGQGTSFINTHIEEWIGPGLFLAFDRYALDREVAGALTRTELLSMVSKDELHKLMGATQKYLDSVAPLLADQYLRLGGLNRVNSPAVLDATGVAIVSSPAAPGSSFEVSAATPAWSDEDAEDVAIVLRRLQVVQAQIRNALHVRELKALYKNACMFCGKQTLIGVGPSKYYSEAAHIQPVGQPHNGPDQKNNMLVLCPEHHLQFDRGVLRIRKRLSELQIESKIIGDPLNGSAVQLLAPHTLKEDCVSWHYQFWKP